MVGLVPYLCCHRPTHRLFPDLDLPRQSHPGRTGHILCGFCWWENIGKSSLFDWGYNPCLENIKIRKHTAISMILLVLLHPSWIEQTCWWLQAIPILFLPGGEVMIVGNSCKVKMKNSMSARIQLNEGLTALRRPSRGHRSAAFNGQAWLHHGCNVTSHCGSDGGRWWQQACGMLVKAALTYFCNMSALYSEIFSNSWDSTSHPCSWADYWTWRDHKLIWLCGQH